MGLLALLTAGPASVLAYEEWCHRLEEERCLRGLEWVERHLNEDLPGLDGRIIDIFFLAKRGSRRLVVPLLRLSARKRTWIREERPERVSYAYRKIDDALDELVRRRLPEFFRALRHQDPAVRRQAIRSIAGHSRGSAEAHAAFLGLVHGDRHEEVRRYAALGMFLVDWRRTVALFQSRVGACDTEAYGFKLREGDSYEIDLVDLAYLVEALRSAEDRKP